MVRYTDSTTCGGSIFPSLINKTPRYLNCSTRGRTSPPTQRGQRPPFSSCEPWLWTWRLWFSSQPLHAQLQTALIHVDDPGLMKPTGQHQEEQKAEMKSCDSQTGLHPWPHLVILFIKFWTELLMKGSHVKVWKKVWLTAGNVNKLPLQSDRDRTAPSKGPWNP